MSPLDPNEIFEEVIYELELKNAIRLLPELEQKVYSYLLEIDNMMALSSSDISEYLQKNQEKTPLQRTAEHFCMSTDEIKSIVRNAERLIKEMMA